jgi:hypothetical protein
MILGIRAMMKALGVNHAYIGVKITMEGAIEALHEKILNEKGIDVVPFGTLNTHKGRTSIDLCRHRKRSSSGACHTMLGVAVCERCNCLGIGANLANRNASR